MSQAHQIVSALLEDDLPSPYDADDPLEKPTPEELHPDAAADPADYLSQYADQLEREEQSGELTPRTALTATKFWHRTLKYSDGRTPIRVRKNGATKTWKTRPSEFKIPVKYGFKECFYITDRDANDWSTQPLPSLPKPIKTKANRDRSGAKPPAPLPSPTI